MSGTHYVMMDLFNEYVQQLRLWRFELFAFLLAKTMAVKAPLFVRNSRYVLKRWKYMLPFAIQCMFIIFCSCSGLYEILCVSVRRSHLQNTCTWCKADISNHCKSLMPNETVVYILLFRIFAHNISHHEEPIEYVFRLYFICNMIISY